MRSKLSLLIVTTLVGASSYAGECVLQTTRTACPGKEKQALAPYGGKATAEDKKDAADAAACGALADKEAPIKRKGTLSAKTVVAKFGGAEVKTATAKSECD